MSKRSPMLPPPTTSPPRTVKPYDKIGSSPVDTKALMEAPCTPLRWVQTGPKEIEYQVLAWVQHPQNASGKIGAKGVAFLPAIEIESGRMPAAVVPVKDSNAIRSMAQQQEQKEIERRAMATKFPR